MALLVSIWWEPSYMKKLIIALLIFCCRSAEAQTPSCTGSLGDPIVNITFGAGTGFGGPLAAGITNMTYIADQCPSDGYYTIVSKTSGCFGNTWLTVNQDHTGNANGYFMLINASYNPSDFYVQTIDGLCTGTTFQFAAWIMNIGAAPNQIEPNITFTIEKTDGTPLATYSTGDIPQSPGVKWIQYGFFFTTPPGVSTVILKMTNNAMGGDGNDLCLDDITFRAAGPAISLTGSAGFADDSITLCQSDARTITFAGTVQNCYMSPVYQWQQSTDGEATWSDIPGATTTSYSRPQSGVGGYDYRLTVAQAANIGNSFCTVASTPAVVSVIATPSPQISIAAADNNICSGSPANFTATPTDGGNSPVYQWMVNNVNMGSGGTTFTSSALSSSDVVSCTMTSDATCVLNPLAVSNNLSLTVTPNPVSSVDIAGSANGICQDSVVTFTATPFNGGGDPSYQWTVNGANVGSNAPVFTDGTLNNGDIVSCILTSSLTCATPVTAAQPVAMTVYPLPTIQLSPDTVIAGGQSITLSPVITGNIASWQWTPGSYLDNSGVSDPVATPLGTTTYQLQVVTVDGCKASASEVVGVFYSVQMPGAFTPNGDGRNDVFRVPPLVPITIRFLAVYNREGMLLFSTANKGVGWDGRYNGHPQPTGVYVWQMEYDNPLTKRTEFVKGTVLLVR